ncbi:hypothetical protein QJS04_geneDACA022870 [Acorus gramineus]|uniref:IBH1-like N-terminal domain-containing protein n=1 Tax=Acorus gramineus TaxID=55184 RepID=A0AAV9B043_ACOGR|nr:hypothetical protein QJS04_geneDACA022870 [Acorus gramineus]
MRSHKTKAQLKSFSQPFLSVSSHSAIAMQASNAFKAAFLRKMLEGLQLGLQTSENMSLAERKEVVKVSSDVAMAFARGGANWSRAIITNLSKEGKTKSLVRTMLGKDVERFNKPSHTSKKVTTKKILKRSYRIRRTVRKSFASGLTRSLVKKRTQVLKRIVPGGDSLNDELSFLGETLDYVVSLKARVDLMQGIANAVDALNRR